MDAAHDLGLGPKPGPGVFQVGKLYNPTRTSWPEATQFNFREGEYELLLFFKSLSLREVDAVKSGRVEFGLVVEPPLVVLLFRFDGQKGSLGWGDAPYSYWMVPPATRVPPLPLSDLTPESRVLLAVHLVDAATGILLVNRVVTFSPAFSRTLIEAVHAQVSGPPTTDAVYNRAVDSLFARFSDTNQLLYHPAGVARCVGGE